LLPALPLMSNSALAADLLTLSLRLDAEWVIRVVQFPRWQPRGVLSTVAAPAGAAQRSSRSPEDDATPLFGIREAAEATSLLDPLPQRHEPLRGHPRNYPGPPAFAWDERLRGALLMSRRCSAADLIASALPRLVHCASVRGRSVQSRRQPAPAETNWQ